MVFLTCPRLARGGESISRTRGDVLTRAGLACSCDSSWRPVRARPAGPKAPESPGIAETIRNAVARPRTARLRVAVHTDRDRQSLGSEAGAEQSLFSAHFLDIVEAAGFTDGIELDLGWFECRLQDFEKPR